MSIKCKYYFEQAYMLHHKATHCHNSLYDIWHNTLRTFRCVSGVFQKLYMEKSMYANLFVL